MRVHENVRHYIAEHCLVRSSVAKRAGIPSSSFYAMLKGKQKMYPEDLRAICYALSISADVFFEQKEPS